jgi:hypothetical protein
MRSVSLLKAILLVAPLALSACDDEPSDYTRGSDAPPSAARDRSPPGPTPTLRQRRPPEAAYAACAGRSDGSSCTVTFPDRTLSGSCVAPPNGDGKLACLPADFGRREHSGRELERKLDRLPDREASVTFVSAR